MRFFEKDTADHASNAKEYETFYTALATLKRNNAALSAIPAHNKGVFLDAKNPNILVYCQKHNGNWVDPGRVLRSMYNQQVQQANRG